MCLRLYSDYNRKYINSFSSNYIKNESENCYKWFITIYHKWLNLLHIKNKKLNCKGYLNLPSNHWEQSITSIVMHCQKGHSLHLCITNSTSICFFLWYAVCGDKRTFDSIETLSRTPAFTAKPPHVARCVRWQSCHVLPTRLSALCLYLLPAKSYNPQNRESYVKQMYSWCVVYG